jgi:hypothetical protein
MSRDDFFTVRGDFTHNTVALGREDSLLTFWVADGYATEGERRVRRSRLAVGLVGLVTAAGLAVGFAGSAEAQTTPNTAKAAAQAPAAAPVSVPVTGTLTDALGGTGAFTGTFTPTQIVNQGGSLAAVGTLTGTLTNSLGAVLGSVSQAVTVPLAVTGTCQILNLDLGPLDLNLLGLVVHLNEVVLNITADQAPGNLLGNLLCAVSHLLDSNGNSTNAIVNLLNRILARL